MYAAQESLLAALRGTAAGGSARALVDAARSRLLLWGLWPEQVEAIEREGKARPTVEILSPLSGVVTRKAVVVGDYVMEGSPLFDVADLSTVWLKARVYEDDLGVVAAGRKVSATTSAYPGQVFEGAVVFVDPFLDRKTRTADLRADLPNPDGRLKPGMYVAATIRVPLVEVEPYRSLPKPPPGEPRTVYTCPMHPDVVCDAPGKCEECGGMEIERKEMPGGPGPSDVLAVPETAVVDTGRRKVAYVESSPGVFDAREVTLGPRSGAFYPVISGVEAGMRVATAGSFLIDAETRLNPAAAGTYFGASGTGHEGHGK
jgi:Cu(I)/Ag(I) efflux system membrane fusion protein